MRSPYDELIPGDLRLPLRLLGGMALLSGIALLVLDVPLKTDASPLGIASFELAGDRATAEAMIAQWEASPPAMLCAALSLGVDYLFMFAYALCLGMLTLRLTAPMREARPALAKAGVCLAWAWLLAGALDAVENFGLVQLLLGGGGEWAAPLAFVCASSKFVIVLIGLLFLPASWLIAMMSPGHRRN